MTLAYPEEARERLLDCRPEELKNFARGIPAPKLQQILNRLPPMSGFRPGKDIDPRLLTFFGKISRWTEDEWSLMAEMWMLWTEARPIIKENLNVHSESEVEALVQGMSTSAEARRNAITKLVRAARGGSLTQEMIRNWYWFGPFPSDSEVLNLIELAPTQEESSLFARVATVEQKALQLERDYQKLVADIKPLQADYRGIAKLPTNVTEVQNKLRGLEIQLHQLANRVDQVERAVHLVNKALDAHTAEKKGVATELGQLKDQVIAMQQGLVEMREDSLARMAAYDRVEEAVSNLRDQLAELQETVVSLRLEVEHSLKQPTLTMGSASIGQEGRDGAIRAPVSLAVQYCSYADPVLLEDTRTVIAHLANNLNRLGIKLPHARLLAREMVAALAAGQLVTLDGSLGFAVAERCALSVAGEAVYTVRIPVGLLDGMSLELQLNELIRQSSLAPGTVSVIFEGINRSALEAYGAFLRQFVIERILRLRHDGLSLLLFATLEEGPAAIPWGRGILEVGPVFATDALGWMDKAVPGVPGRIPREVWLEVARPRDTKPGWKDFSLPDWLLLEGGALWRQTLLTAISFHAWLSNDGDSALGESISAVAFGWLLPMAFQTRPDSLTEVVEGIELDERMKSLLLRWAPGVTSG